MRQDSSLRHSLALAPACLAVAAAVLGTPVSARAAYVGSTGSLPGTACRKVGTIGTLAYTVDGAIYNNVAWGSPALTVECPVASAAQGTITFVNTTVTYLDNTPGSMSCTLRTEDNDSTAFHNWTQTSTGDDFGYRTMDFSNVQGFADGHVHFRCTIPAKDTDGNPSYLVGYEVHDDPINDPLGHLGYHTFPGNMCRQVSSGTAGLTADGAISNSGTTSLTFDCPVMATRSGDVSLSRTKIWYLDSSPSVFTCTMAAEAADSTAASQINLNSNVDDNAYHAFTYSGSNAITTFDDGYVHARCIVPPPDAGGAASFIVGYGVEIN